MYVCLCKAVTDRQIREAVSSGALRMRDLRCALGVSSECGQCARCALSILRENLTGAMHELAPASEST